MTQRFTGKHQLVERLSSQVGSKELAVHILQKRGDMQSDGETLTSKGRARDAMTAEQRAIDRASTETGRPKAVFRYDEASNRATIRPGARKKAVTASVIKKTWRSR